MKNKFSSRLYHLCKVGVVQLMILLIFSNFSFSGSSMTTISSTSSAALTSDIHIPLETIWALDMPGTKPMNRIKRGSPLAYEAPEGQLVDEIRVALKYNPQRHPTTGPCFVVQGSGMTALRNAHAVLVNNTKPQIDFSAGEEMSLVFYSYQFGSYVHLVDVIDKGGDVEIHFRFVPHRTEEITAHLALIPFSFFQPGHHTITVSPESDEENSTPSYAAWAEKIVCGPGGFDIQKR